MSPLLLYLLKSTLSLLVLYVAFMLSSRSARYFQFNRFFLVASMLVATLLPLFTFHLSQLPYTLPLLGEEILISSQRFQFNLEEVVISATATDTASTSWSSLVYLFGFIYVAGVMAKSLQLAWRIWQLYSIKRRSEVIKQRDFTFVFTPKGTPTFSFYRWIFIDASLYKNEKEALHIIEHEKVHLRQGHSFDILLVELISIIQWFNPIVYLLRQYVKENHEFIADELVVAQYQDEQAYRLLLLQHASHVNAYGLTHNFSYSLLKRRLQMMKKPKSPLGFSLALAGLVVALNLVFFACSDPNTDIMNQSDAAMNDDKVYSQVETSPQYPGGMDSLVQYLVKNITYPQQSKDQGVEGKVVVEFVVEKDGSIQDVSVKKGLDPLCDKEAKRVIANMPNWTPGLKDGKAVRVSFALPINFALNQEDNSEVFKVVEDMPEFPGGMNAMMSYLGDNITYPEAAKEEGVQGRVFVSFVIEKDGRVTNVKLLRGIGGACDEEALRVVSEMPRWKPGYSEGKAVRVAYNLPIKYSLK